MWQSGRMNVAGWQVKMQELGRGTHVDMGIQNGKSWIFHISLKTNIGSFKYA